MVVWMSGWTMPMVVMGVPLWFVFFCFPIDSMILLDDAQLWSFNDC